MLLRNNMRASRHASFLAWPTLLPPVPANTNQVVQVLNVKHAAAAPSFNK